MRANGRCRQCFGLIVWGRTISGTDLAFDPEPHHHGTIVIDRHVGDAITVIDFGADPIPPRFPVAYQNHECPV